ncbi:MAG TPA: DUF2059 domain-containing protein [Burkholderiaceae bacterium]|nr:DUF2059 domain-containing protein [Burkholderiaceae bacterium]
MKATRMNALKLLAAATTLACASVAMAQGPAPAAPASSPAKKELVAKVLQHQQQGVEIMARNMLQAPVAQLMQGAGGMLQQMPADKREAAAKAIEADVKKFIEENGPFLRDKAQKLSPSTVGAILEEKFTEDELKQILAWLDSPVSKKFGQLGGEMQKALGDKLLAENGATLDARFKVLQQNVAKHLGVSMPGAASSPAANKNSPKK